MSEPVSLFDEPAVGKPLLIRRGDYRSTPIVVAIHATAITFATPPFPGWPCTLSKEALRT